MTWLKDNWFKVALLVVILVGFIAVGCFIYATQVVKQDSIERQQRFESIELKAERDREYAASQKNACLTIYKQESEKWPNVDSWRYIQDEDACYIRYKESPKKTEAECDARFKGSDGKVIPLFADDWLLCKDGLFQQSF